MAPPADREKRGVGRMVERGETRQVRRARRSQSRAVLRLSERSDVSVLTSAPDDVQAIARSEGGIPAHRAADMRSRLVRKVVEMEVLDSSRAIARDAEPVVQRSAASAGDKGKGKETVFEKWYSDLSAQGLSDREIEEHVAARVRGVRRGIAMLAEERRVGRR